MTTNAMSAQQATQTLRAAGYTVQVHGARFIVGATPVDKRVLDAGALIALAERTAASEAPAGWKASCGQCGQQFISDAPIADGAICANCTGAAASDAPAPIGALSNPSWPTLPMTELFAVLEGHAKRLGTLTPGTIIPVPRGLPDRLLVPIGTVVPGRYQPRLKFDEAELQGLAESIREHGIINPPIVFANERGDFELIAGERRLRAAHIVGLSMLPIEIRPYILKEIAEISGVDNLQRAQLTALEKGRYFNRLIAELGISENALAKRLGIARPTIQQCRAVAAGATELHAALEAEQITFSQARAIALAAPGDHKAQKQTLGVLIERAKNGRAMSEAEARQETEKILRKRLEADLKKLGWQFTNGGDVWAEGERPTKWSGAEMIEAVKTARRPAGEPPATEADPAQLALASMRCDPSPAIYGRWVGLAPTWNTPYTYYAPDEIAALAAEVEAALAAYAARAQKHGWTLEVKRSNYLFRGPNGGREIAYYWRDLEKTLEQIESGALVDRTPPASSAPPPPRPTATQKCAACGKETTGGSLRYIDGKYRCPDCAAPILAAREAASAKARATIDTAMGAWLRAAPAGALALLYAVSSGEAVDEGITIDGTIDDIATYMAEWEIDPEEAPNVAALLGMAPAPTEADAETDADTLTPAGLIVDLLAHADDTPAVAARLGVTPPAEPEASAEAAGPLGTLAVISAAIEGLEEWAFGLTNYDREEIAAAQLDARALRHDLENLSLAPEVSDEAYDRWSSRLGDIEDGIKEALKALNQEVVPA